MLKAQVIIPISIILGFWILAMVVGRFLVPILLSYSKRTASELDEQIVTAFTKPLRALVFVLGVYIALLYLPLSPAADLVISRVFRSLLIIMLAWGAHLMAGADSILAQSLKQKLKIESILIPSLAKALQFVIWSLAMVLLAHEWGYDVNGFIAGLGLGGLAFALAAKDMLANIFGGIVIIMEKPFIMGDWVETPSVEGRVEDISFRSTRFRTFAQALVTVPNSTLANEAITNWSRMGTRRVRFTLGIDYAGPRETIEKCLQALRRLLTTHPGIDPTTVLVNLEAINVNSLEIVVQYFSLNTNTDAYMALKEQVNFDILDILAEHRLALAAPGRLVYSQVVNETKVK